MTQKFVRDVPDKTQQRFNSREGSSAFAQSFYSGLHPVYQLQRMLGNRNVARMVQAKQLTPGGEIIGLQRKLTVGAKNDQYEQEADRVSRQVMNTADPVATASADRASSLDEAQNQTPQTKPLNFSITPIVQPQKRKENEVGKDKNREEEKDESIQAKSVSDLTALPFQAGGVSAKRQHNLQVSVPRNESELDADGVTNAVAADASTGGPVMQPAARTIAREPAAGPYTTVGVGTPLGDSEGSANAAPQGIMTAGFWGCLFGLLGGCQPVPDPNAREVIIDSFRTSGKTSDENKCDQCPRDLGVVPGVGRNGMELRGTVNGYVPGVKYDFKRERKGRTFERIDGLWRTLITPGKDDDTDNADEFLTPVNGHIYAIDQPGAIDPQDPCDPKATEFVQKLSMTEWVNVRRGPAEPWARGSDYFYWHSVVWLRKVDGVWRTDEEKSEIGPGTIYVDTKVP